jgi:hypothetical protein
VPFVSLQQQIPFVSPKERWLTCWSACMQKKTKLMTSDTCNIY